MEECKPESTWCLVHRDGSVLASRKSMQSAMRTAEVIGSRVFRYVPMEEVRPSKHEGRQYGNGKKGSRGQEFKGVKVRRV